MRQHTDCKETGPTRTEGSREETESHLNRPTPNDIFPRDLEASDVDVAGLRRFYRSDPNAPKVLDILAARESDSSITTVSSMVARLRGAGFAITRPEIMGEFKARESFNCGKFIKEPSIVSRADRASRFEWKVSLVRVGRKAADKKIR